MVGLGWVGLGWVGLGWVGLGWVGLGWVGLGWVGLGWVGLGWVGLGWVGLGWVGLGWVGLGWVGLGVYRKGAELLTLFVLFYCLFPFAFRPPFFITCTKKQRKSTGPSVIVLVSFFSCVFFATKKTTPSHIALL